MAVELDPSLLDLYGQELSYLRERGSEFSQRYPKVAARLGVTGRQVSDPHVERLIESFAFLTARLNLQLARDLPELTTGLLGVLYPQYTSPIPSMAIAAFGVDINDAGLVDGHVIEKDTPLRAVSATGPECQFRTCYPVSLLAVAIQSAEYVPWDDLRLSDSVIPVSDDGSRARPLGAIRIRLASGVPPEKLEGKRIRFFVSGDPIESSRIYDLLFERGRQALVVQGEGDLAPDLARLHPVGFAEDDDVLVYPPHAHPGHRLVQEYFAFPQKFLFFDVELLGAHGDGPVDLLVLLDRRPAGVAIRKETFRLGCTPIINLFARAAEPIRVDGHHPEYRIVADSRRERYTEIHSVLEVSATGPGEPEQRPYAPFFSFSHPDPVAIGAPNAFWFARRTAVGRADMPGSDLYLSFVNLAFDPTAPWSELVYARVLCTNRDLTTEIEAGAQLLRERPAPVTSVVCLIKPTPQVAAPLGGQSLWRLVSNLSLSHLSLGGEHGAEALREVLRAYLFTSTREAEKQIAAIERVDSRVVQRRVGEQGWRGLSRGTEVTVELAEDQLGDSSPILFAEVLSRFLSLYAHLSSFTELVLRSTLRGEVWKRWPPMAGAKPLL